MDLCQDYRNKLKKCQRNCEYYSKMLNFFGCRSNVTISEISENIDN